MPHGWPRHALWLVTAAVLGAGCGWLSLYLFGLVFTVVAVVVLSMGNLGVRGTPLVGFGMGYLGPAGLFGSAEVIRDLADGDLGSAAIFAGVVAVGVVVVLVGVSRGFGPPRR